MDNGNADRQIDQTIPTSKYGLPEISKFTHNICCMINAMSTPWALLTKDFCSRLFGSFFKGNDARVHFFIVVQKNLVLPSTKSRISQYFPLIEKKVSYEYQSFNSHLYRLPEMVNKTTVVVKGSFETGGNFSHKVGVGKPKYTTVA